MGALLAVELRARVRCDGRNVLNARWDAEESEAEIDTGAQSFEYLCET